MYNKLFIRDALERALKTLAQTTAALLSVDGLDILTLNWKQLVSTAVLAALISLLTSIGSAGVGESGSASLVVESVETK